MPASSGYGSKRNRLRDRVAYVRTDCNFTPDMSVSCMIFTFCTIKHMISVIVQIPTILICFYSSGSSNNALSCIPQRARYSYQGT